MLMCGAWIWILDIGFPKTEDIQGEGKMESDKQDENCLRR